MKIRYIGIALILLAAGILAACSGGSSTATSGFSQTFTASAGAGEVMQFSIDTANMTYSYKVVESSYNNTFVGKTSTGLLSGKTAIGSYTVGPSADNFIQAGVVFPVQNGLLVGHVQISLIGGTFKIPVFGVSNPVTNLAGLADTYNFEGFACGLKSGGNVLGAFACLSHYGTIKVDALGNYTVCKSGNITTTPACATSTGTIMATATPGVFDFVKTGTGHIGWFLAFTAPNGQKVAVIDHDDASTPAYGHSVATTQAAMVAGAADGNYFTRNNEGGASLLAVSGTTFTDIITGVSGTLTTDTPWTGLTTYQIAASSGVAAASGVAMIAGTGAYTYNSSSDAALFGVGLRY